WREAELVQNILIFSLLKHRFEDTQGLVLLKSRDALFFLGGQKVRHLDKRLDDLFGLFFLLYDIRGKALHIVVAVFIMEEPKLPYGTVVNNPPVHKNVVSVPV